MWNFIKRLSLFFVPIIIGFCVFEVSLRKIPNDYSYKEAYLTKNASTIEVLILGNSHAYRGIIPKKIDLYAFNAAYISQSLDLDFLIFNKYKKKLKKLKYLIINISYPSLFGTLKESKESWRIKNYNLYYNFNITNKPEDYSEVLSNKYDINKERFVSYYLDNKNLITCSKLGGGTKDETRDIKASAVKAAKRHTKKGLPYYKEYVDELNNIIQYSKKNGIKLIFVTTPVYKMYAEHTSSVQLNLMNTLLDSITNKNNNVFRLNLFEDKTFYKNDFLDADHLNKNGAVKLTSKINSFINKTTD